MARTSNYALRLLTSLKAEAEKVAAEEGATLNQFIEGSRYFAKEPTCGRLA